MKRKLLHVSRSRFGQFKTIAAFLFLTGICCGQLMAQQKPLFTHYVFNDYYYNPAVASTKEGADFKAVYRHQWAGLNGQPKTATFSGCGALKKFPLGIGGNIYYDKTGPLGNVGFNVSASYGIRIKKESMISAGLSFGIIRFSMENDVNARDANPDVAVLAAQDGKVVPDISLGIYYKYKGFYAGFSIPQIVQSKLDLEIDDPADMNKLVRHYFIATGYKFKVAEKFQLEPSVLLKAVKAAPLQGDITLRGIYNKMVWLGLTYRTGDAVAVFAGVEVKEMFQIGYAYDITTSNLNSVSNGSHEIVLGYSWKRSKSSSGSKGYEVR